MIVSRAIGCARHAVCSSQRARYGSLAAITIFSGLALHCRILAFGFWTMWFGVKPTLCRISKVRGLPMPMRPWSGPRVTRNRRAILLIIKPWNLSTKMFKCGRTGCSLFVRAMNDLKMRRDKNCTRRKNRRVYCTASYWRRRNRATLCWIHFLDPARRVPSQKC